MSTICHYGYITATSTISEENSSNSNAPRLPTKVILPKKKSANWSTGTGVGEYGGPPVTTKLRKYWGGEKEDPITSDEFIWNNDFMPRMKRLLDKDSDGELDKSVKEEPSGFLSLNRVMSLDSMEIDMSKELRSAPNRMEEKPVEVAQAAQITIKRWKLAPTRREQDKWDRATKAATGGSDVILREVKKPRGDPKLLAAQATEQYIKLKNRLQIYTFGVGGVGLVSSYVSYSPEIAASYGAGFLGSLVYMRMLGTSVDSLADGARGFIKGAIGQPRLLVPVVLVMVYNRWNGILVPEYGVMQLQLIPMLVGFFTYKIATFVQVIEESLTVGSTKE